MILYWAFVINLILGAGTTLWAFFTFPQVKEQFAQLEGCSFLTKTVVLTRAFMLNHWEYLFDWLTYLTYDPFDGDDDDGDTETNTSTQGR